MMLLAGSASAHDIGVSQAELKEVADGRYVFTARVAAGTRRLHGTPELPERCRFDGAPGGIPGGEGWVWVFSCSDRLSAEDEIHLPWRRDGAMVVAHWLNGSSGQRLFGNDNGVIILALQELQAGSPSLRRAAGRYTRLGVEHILAGFDHLLFVLGLLLLVAGPPLRIRALFLTITAFTVAHSITLGLATLGFVDVATAPVEAAIALSIVYLAMEVIRGWQGREGLTHRQPWLVAFGFGLLHGLGFAGALADVGLPVSDIPVALLFFNVGVELGQLLFLTVVILAVTVVSRPVRSWPQWVRYAPVYMIGSVGAYWVLERVNGMIV